MCACLLREFLSAQVLEKDPIGRPLWHPHYFTKGGQSEICHVTRQPKPPFDLLKTAHLCLEMGTDAYISCAVKVQTRLEGILRQLGQVLRLAKVLGQTFRPSSSRCVARVGTHRRCPFCYWIIEACQHYSPQVRPT